MPEEFNKRLQIATDCTKNCGKASLLCGVGTRSPHGGTGSLQVAQVKSVVLKQWYCRGKCRDSFIGNFTIHTFKVHGQKTKSLIDTC